VRDLRLEQAGWDAVYLLRPPFGRDTTSRDYAAALTRRHGPFGADVYAVLAYCMAAPIAQEITAALNATGVPAPLLLFDGEPVTAEVVAREVRLAEDRVRGTGARAGLPAWTTERLAADPDGYVELLRRGLVELGAEHAGDEEDAADAAEFYLDWLVYMLAGHNAAWSRLDHEVWHITSRDHTFTGDWPGAPATRSYRVPAPRDTLLAHPDTRELVRDLLHRLASASRSTTERGSRG
jgi:hypothetical protein